MKYVIYIIQNKINHKIYIGKTINFAARIDRHKRMAENQNDPRHLYCAIRKYGWNNFEYYIIEDNIDISEIDDAEIFWIQNFRSWDKEIGYNLTLGGEGGIPTLETRAKMRQAKLGKPNPNMQGENHPLYGVKGEQHHRFGIPHTPEAKIKISQAGLKREDYPMGSDCHSSKLTEQDVLYMREYFYNNPSIKTNDVLHFLANKFGVVEGTVDAIIYNRNWKHVKMFPTTNKNKKLQDQDIIFIRQEMNNATDKTNRRKELSVQLNISLSTIYDIETFRRRKNVK